CSNCHRRFSVLVRSQGSNETQSCPYCKSNKSSKAFSTFSVRSKSDRDVYEGILDDQQLVRGMLSEDPRSLAEWNNRMSQGMDEEVAPEHQEMVERMEKGEMPSELVRNLKQEGDGAGDGGAGED
ncbi:MAG: hypothetical protein U1D67_08235, partial [Dehalococcoidia bacterium]|nr:hypothetical protein [Dehalococcoidia bacterium]